MQPVFMKLQVLKFIPSRQGFKNMNSNKFFMLFLLVAALLFLSFGRKDSLGSAAMEEKQPCLITINETENMRWIVENSLTGFEADDWNPNGQWLSDYDSVQAWDSSELKRLLPRMVKVTGGTYTMTGRSFKSMSRKDDGSPYVATVNDFMVADIEVTEELYHFVMGGTFPKEDARLPVEKVRWYNAVIFCNRLSLLCGYTPCYREMSDERPPAYHELKDHIICDYSANGFRLPSSEEWEFAARGGEKHAGYTYIGSDEVDDVAWYDENSGNGRHEVAKKRPNELDLYDMGGNVTEWCNDWNVLSTPVYQSDEVLFSEDGVKIFRGGSYQFPSFLCKTNTIGILLPYYVDGGRGNDCFGFRLFRTVSDSE